MSHVVKNSFFSFSMGHRLLLSIQENGQFPFLSLRYCCGIVVTKRLPAEEIAPTCNKAVVHPSVP